MKDLPKDWAEYARIQKQLIGTSQSSDRHWGLEFALNKTLDEVEKDKPVDSSDVERRVRTGARKNRYRAQLERLHRPLQPPEMADPRQSNEARCTLLFLHDTLGSDSFRLLFLVGVGHGYGPLASQHGLNASTLRKRVSRLRSRARQLTNPEH